MPTEDSASSDPIGVAASSAPPAPAVMHTSNSGRADRTGRRLRRLPATISFAILATLLVGSSLYTNTASAAACGSPGQRACCLLEPPTNGGCVSGAIEVPKANAGVCTGFNPLGIQASGICVAETPCGGVNQRACCLLEAGFGACQSGLIEQPQANSGYCSNSVAGIQSSGVCRAVTPCGGADQRACCLGEAGFGACKAGNVEVPQANSGQCANSIWGIQSSGVCRAVTPCGGENERACCLLESEFGACVDGLVEVPQANSGYCGNSVLGIQSSGVCEVVTPCGSEGERACCVGEASFGACEDGLNEHPQANSGYCGNSILGIQSSGVCKAASNLGEACGPLYQCEAGLFCDPFAGFTCVDSGGIDEPCGPLVPCADGLQCSLALRCSEEPAQLGQTCDVTAPCDEGLFCQPGIPQRCRALKKPGEGCSIVNPCIEGASCDPCLVEGCNAPLQCNWNTNEGAISEAVCRSLYSPDLAAAARDTGLTMTYAVGDEIAGLIGESQSFGVSYGQNDEYGCFTTLCGGLNADVSIEIFATIGFYTEFDAVGGKSFANFQEVEILGVLNFGTSQVFPRIELLPLPELIGTEDSFALGVSPDLLPFSAGSFLCETVLDHVVIEPVMDGLPEVSSRPATVVANSGLRVDLEGWTCSDPDLCEWSPDDALGLMTSGSAEVRSPSASGPVDATSLAASCVSVRPGQAYELLAHVKSLGPLPGIVRALWYAGLECNGEVVRTDEVASSAPDETWRAIADVGRAPDDAQSVALEISAERDDDSGLESVSRFDFVTISETTAAVTLSSGSSSRCGLVGAEPLLVFAAAAVARRRRCRRAR